MRFGPRPFMVVGTVLNALGLGWLSQISADSGYVTGILLPIILFAAGMGCLFVPLTVTAVSNVTQAESGAASGLLNVMQQVGGSLGLSILVTVFSHRHEERAEVAGLERAGDAAVAAGHRRADPVARDLDGVPDVRRVLGARAADHGVRGAHPQGGPRRRPERRAPVAA